MRISAIAAMDRAGAIGVGGRLPWHLPRDLKRFRSYTWGKPIVMGRNTFLSLPAPLAGRYHLVLSRQPDWMAPGCQVVHSIDQALAAADAYLAATGGSEVMIIGGAEVFRETAPRWQRVYLTRVEGRYAADTFFPLEALRRSRWRLVESESCPADARNRAAHHFVVLERPSGNDPEEADFDVSRWLGGGPFPVGKPA